MLASVLLCLYTCLKNEPYIIFMACFPQTMTLLLLFFRYAQNVFVTVIVLDLWNPLTLINKQTKKKISADLLQHDAVC